MKVLYYDCFSGISGDMNMAALVDLGVEQSYLIRELDKLGLQGYSVSFKPDQRKGITGTRADVTLTDETGNSNQSFKFYGLTHIAAPNPHLC